MARKIRLLQLIDLLGPGGAETLLLTLATAIDHDRFEMHVCSLRAAPAFPQADTLRAAGVKVKEFDHQGTRQIPASVVQVARYIVRNRIDIVHTHLVGSDVVGRLAGFLAHRPVISTVHNFREDLAREPRRRQQLDRLTARLFNRWLVVVSPLLRKEVAEWYGLPLSKAVIVANGVDTERFQAPRDDLLPSWRLYSISDSPTTPTGKCRAILIHRSQSSPSLTVSSNNPTASRQERRTSTRKGCR